MLIVIITIKIPPKKEKEILQSLCALSELILKEEGCINYNIYQESGRKHDFCLIEKWRSWEDWNDYLTSDRFKVLLGAMSLLNEMPDIQISTTSHAKEANTLMTQIKENLIEVDADV